MILLSETGTNKYKNKNNIITVENIANRTLF